MANIQKYLDDIKKALFGREVRSSIHDAIEAINKETERTTASQEHLDSTFKQLIINAGQSNAEVVDARVEANGTPHATLGDRLDNLDIKFGITNKEVVDARTDKNGIAHKDLKTRLDNVDSQLAQKTKLLNNRIEVINDITDTKGTIDLANFAKQGEASAPIGVIVHHYTDGTLAQFDNVGENNTILILKNAQNTQLRPDKDKTFVGNGSFLRLVTHNNDLGYSETDFILDKNAEFIFTRKTGVIAQNKQDDGLYAYMLKNYNAHLNICIIKNGANDVLSIKNDVNYTRLSISSDKAQTNGMYINTRAGNIRLHPNDGWVDCIGKIRTGDGSSTGWKTVAKISRGTTANRPTDFEIGECYFDADLNKPIWRNRTDNGWVDAMGNPV